MIHCHAVEDDGAHCGRLATEVRLKCPAGRPDAVAAYCDLHGGEERARAVASRDWKYVAPASVGDALAVEDAGCQCLGTPEAYVVVRQTSKEQGGTWLAWLGLGSRLTAVVNGQPRLRANGRPRMRHGKPHGTHSFATRAEALERAKAAWKEGVERRVAEIRRARGGTLSWGTPVEPFSEPIVILLEQGDSRSAWDIAKQLARRSPEGVGILTGLRPSGEVL